MTAPVGAPPLCLRCGKSHGFAPSEILAGCAAVSAVEFSAKGVVTRLEFFPEAPAKPAPTTTRHAQIRRVVVETKMGTDGKRVVTKTRTV